MTAGTRVENPKKVVPIHDREHFWLFGDADAGSATVPRIHGNYLLRRGNKYTIPNGNLDLSEIIPEYREWHELAEEENRFSKPHLHSKLTLNPKQHLNLSTQALI